MSPDVGQEKADRQFQRDKIAELFKMHPLEDIPANVLRAMTPHYQQRISECRRELGMFLENRPQWAEDGAGAKKRLDGSYRWRPDGKPLGVDAGVPDRAPEWPTAHGRPFEPVFELKG